MANPTPEETQKQFERLQSLATALRKDLSQFDLSSLRNDAALVGELLEKWEGELSDASQSLDSISSSFQSVVSEISKGNKGLADTKRSFNKLTSLAQDLQSHNAGINKLSADQLRSLEKQALKEKLKLQTTLDTLEADKQAIIFARRNGEQNASQLEQLRKINAAQNEIKGTIDGQNQSFEDLITNARDFQQRAENIDDALGLGGNALKGMQGAMGKLGLGGLSESLDMEGATSSMDEMAASLTDNGKNAASLGSKFKILGAGAKTAFKGLGKSLLGPEALIAEFLDALQKSDEAAGKLAKDFNLTYSEALDTRRELGNMAAMSGDVALNTRNLQESMVAVGKALGTNAMLNEKDLITFTKLTQQAGFQADELMEIQKLSLANNESLEDNTKEILGGAKAYAMRNKVTINEKDILREVNKSSASLKLSLGGSVEAVAEAAVKAKQFGLNLEQAEKIANSLLQFETSIEDELSAELLTGKNLNLERARSLALEGKTADAAAEVAKQVGTSKDFAKMNVLQQEALAKAAGMERDGLAQSLIDREALQKIGMKDAAAAKEKYDTLRKTMTAEQAAAALGDEELARQYEQQSVQERFAQATEKLKDVFMQIAEPVLAILSPLVDIVTTILPAVNLLLQPLITGFQFIADIIGLISTGISMFAGWMKEGSAAATALKVVLAPIAAIVGVIAAGLIYASLAMIPVIGPALGAIAVVGMIGMLAKAAMGSSSSAKKGSDIMSPPPGGGGYGKRTLFGPEGAIQLNNKDTIIAGTDLFKKGDDVMSAPKGALTVANSTSPKPQPVQDSSAGTNARLDALISATTKVNAIPTLKIQ